METNKDTLGYGIPRPKEEEPGEDDMTKEPEEPRKRCYFWRQYKYHVNANDISLKGWVVWCDELYEIQHGKKRPKKNKIFVNPDMQIATVKARVWNKDRIEKWLTDHGYNWTRTEEVKYQFPVTEGDGVVLIDSDAEVLAKMAG